MNQEKKIDFPAGITFKSIFKKGPDTGNSIESILSEYNINGQITSKESRTGKFISYTITAEFPSNKILITICGRISKLEGFMSMF